MNFFLVKYGSALFIILALGSILEPVFVDTPFNAPFSLAFRYLSFPIFAIVAGYTFLNRRELIALTGSRAKVYATAILLIPLLILCSGGWISLLNAACRDGQPITYEGPIQRKFETAGRVHGWHIEILDQARGVSMTFDVAREDYAAHRVGDHYSRAMRTGCLQIPYAFRHR